MVRSMYNALKAEMRHAIATHVDVIIFIWRWSPINNIWAVVIKYSGDGVTFWSGGCRGDGHDLWQWGRLRHSSSCSSMISFCVCGHIRSEGMVMVIFHCRISIQTRGRLMFNEELMAFVAAFIIGQECVLGGCEDRNTVSMLWQCSQWWLDSVCGSGEWSGMFHRSSCCLISDLTSTLDIILVHADNIFNIVHPGQHWLLRYFDTRAVTDAQVSFNIDGEAWLQDVDETQIIESFACC